MINLNDALAYLSQC